MIDEQFLVQCSPGAPDGKVSYLTKRQKNGPVLRDVTVTSKFAGKKKRKKKTEDKPDRVFLRPGSVESVQQHEEKFVSNLVDSNMEVIAESPKWVDKSNMIESAAEDIYDVDESAKDIYDVKDRDYDSEEWPPYTGWMELEGVEEDDLGSAQQSRTSS